jgi:glutamate synthase (ferredoxin)
VTNPAIDPLRESLVMSLNIHLGQRGNLLHLKPEDAQTIKLESPVINDAELKLIKSSELGVAELSTLFKVENGPSGLKSAIDILCEQAEAEVKAGKKILILSDRSPLNPPLSRGEGGIDEENSYIPPLVAVGAVQHHLIRKGLRLQASLVVDTAQCWSTHHFACLVGYGASAVCPYLTLETIVQWWHNPKTQKLMDSGKVTKVDLETALENYRKAIKAGLLKILSKMGISLLASYHGAQIFEAIGLGADLPVQLPVWVGYR